MTPIRISFARVGNAKPMYCIEGGYLCSIIDEVIQGVWKLHPLVPRSRIEKTCRIARQCGWCFLDVKVKGGTNGNV
jgi:hypothetical protein